MSFFTRQIRTILSIWIWVEMTILASACFFMQLVLLVLTYPFDRNRFIVGRLFRIMGANIARLSPMWHFQIYGNYPKRLAPKTVVVSNHVSHMDCFLISYLPYEMKWLAKDVLFKIPMIGWGMRLAGDIAIRRGVSDSIEQAMQECRRYLQQGMPVFIFPEGTRATSDTLLPFKKGAFRLAIETGAQILPIAVSGTRQALPKHSWRFGFSRAKVMVGEPIPTEGLTMDDATALTERARDQILEMLKTIEPLTSRVQAASTPKKP